MRTIRIQAIDFDVGAECRALCEGRADIGAVVTFTGCVRGDGDLTSLTLEHYPGMSEREIERHAIEAEQRWQLLAICVIHRIGTLRPGERIVLVAVAASHREAAFLAAEFLMDYLKTRAPFWKLERRGDSANWQGAKPSDTAAALKWCER